jgi:hypothetical protein
MECGSSRARGYWGGGSLYRSGGLLKVRLLRGGSKEPAAPPSVEGKGGWVGCEGFDWQGKRKVSSRFEDLSRPWNFSLLFLFSFRFFSSLSSSLCPSFALFCNRVI